MKRFWVFALRNLIAVLIIIGVAVALPVAHTGALRAPHVIHSSGAQDRDCSLFTCGAFALGWMLLLFVLVALVAVLFETIPILRVCLSLSIDPPPRFVYA